MERGQHAYTRQIDVGVGSRPGGLAPAVAVGSVWAWLTSGTVLRLSAQRALALLE